MSDDRLYGCPRTKGRYYNPFSRGDRRTLKDVFLWKAGYFDEEEELSPLPADFSYPKQLKRGEYQNEVVWINHATFLIKFGGLHILTDPIWGKRCSPFSFIGPKRKRPPAVSLEELPHIDIVLISHNHYDHLDTEAVLWLGRRYPDIRWFVPQGVKQWFDKRGIQHVSELGWWEERVDVPGFKMTSVPAQHFSGRSLFDINESLWCGWVVEKGDQKLYFVGDTGYNQYQFSHIGQKWKTMDLSLIPIGAYRPRAFMSPVHINPEEAVKIHKEVGSLLSLGMHWNTFRLSDEELYRPPYDLFLAMEREKLDPRAFLAVEPGEVICW